MVNTDLQERNDAADQIISLQAEVAELKSKLTSGSKKGGFDSDLVKLLLQNNLRFAEENNNQQIVAMRAAMDAINLSELEQKTNDELAVLKTELYNVKKDLRNREAQEHTMEEIKSLRAEVVEQLKDAEGKTRDELSKMMVSVESMTHKSEYQQTLEELEKVKGDLRDVKEQLKQTEKASNMRLELMTLKKSLETELWNNQGMNKQEIHAIKNAIKKIDKQNIQSKSLEELSVIRRDVQELKDEIMLSAEKQTLQEQLADLKAEVAALSVTAVRKNEQAMAELNKRIDSVSARQDDKIRETDVAELRSELALLRRQVKEKDGARQIKEEIAALQTSLKSEIMETKQRNRQVFDALRETFANLQLEESDLPDSAVEALTKEVKKLKEEVEEQNRANQELQKLQRQVNEKLQGLHAGDDEQRNLVAVKKAVDAVVAFDADDDDSDAIIDELSSVHDSIKEAESHVISLQDVETVKRALESKIKMSDSQSQNIEEILSVVDKLENSSTTRKSAEGDDLRRAIEATKCAVKSSELYRSLSKLELALKGAVPGLPRSIANRFQSEIDHIKSESDKQSLDDIEKNLMKVRDLHDKLVVKIGERQARTGLRKFFGRLVGYKKSKMATPLVPQSTVGTVRWNDESDSKKHHDKPGEDSSSADQHVQAEVTSPRQRNRSSRTESNLVVHHGFEEEKEMSPPILHTPLSRDLPKMRALAASHNTEDMITNEVISKDRSADSSDEGENDSSVEKDMRSTKSKQSLRSFMSKNSSLSARVAPETKKIDVVSPPTSMSMKDSTQPSSKSSSSSVASEKSSRSLSSSKSKDLQNISGTKTEDLIAGVKEFVRSTGVLQTHSSHDSPSSPASSQELTSTHYSVEIEDIVQVEESDCDDNGDEDEEIGLEKIIEEVNEDDSWEEEDLLNLSNISVSMVNQNEHGETDIETIVELKFGTTITTGTGGTTGGTVLPMTMSI